MPSMDAISIHLYYHINNIATGEIFTIFKNTIFCIFCTNKQLRMAHIHVFVRAQSTLSARKARVCALFV